MTTSSRPLESVKSETCGPPVCANAPPANTSAPTKQTNACAGRRRSNAIVATGQASNVTNSLPRAAPAGQRDDRSIVGGAAIGVIIERLGTIDFLAESIRLIRRRRLVAGRRIRQACARRLADKLRGFLVALAEYAIPKAALVAQLRRAECFCRSFRRHRAGIARGIDPRSPVQLVGR